MMTVRLVCPNNKQLFERINGKNVSVRVENLSDIPFVYKMVQNSNNFLDNIIVESKEKLDNIPFDKKWHGIPISLFVPDVGNFKKFANHINIMRELKIHIFLPAENKKNLIYCRILSSLGITCYLVFGQKAPDWNLLADLMVYSIAGYIYHAPIEPFNFISKEYSPEKNISWGHLYFNDPLVYLHVDSKGRVALSHESLIKEDFIEENLEVLNNPVLNEKYRKGINKWRMFFVSNHKCTFCKGWKICHGRLLFDNTTRDCSLFINEMIEIIEQKRFQNECNMKATQ